MWGMAAGRRAVCGINVLLLLLHRQSHRWRLQLHGAVPARPSPWGGIAARVAVGTGCDPKLRTGRPTGCGDRRNRARCTAGVPLSLVTPGIVMAASAGGNNSSNENVDSPAARTHASRRHKAHAAARAAAHATWHWELAVVVPTPISPVELEPQHLNPPEASAHA